MNTLVEKMFGIIMFLAIFVPFQIGLYTSYMDAWEFTQVTNEVTQLVKEEGGVRGRALAFVKELSEAKDSKGADLYGYNIKFLTPKLDASGNIVYEDKSTPSDGVKESVVYVDVPKNTKLAVGQDIQIIYSKKVDGAYNWGKKATDPKYNKITNLTVYKR